jgi:hypothetical protein
VLLAHDQVYATTEDSMELHHFIKRLKENADYELQTASEYPGAAYIIPVEDSIKTVIYK